MKAPTILPLAALAFLCALAPNGVQAQDKQGFTFCMVQDLPNFKTYASPVFDFAYSSTAWFERLQDLQKEFGEAALAAVGAGGARNCYPALSTAAEAERERNDMKVSLTSTILAKWQDVPFSPRPWNPDQPAPMGEAVKYFYCGAANPYRDVRKAAYTSIFEGRVPAADRNAGYLLQAQYSKEFERSGAAGMPGGHPACRVHNSLIEAEKALEGAKMPWTGVSGFNTTLVELSWRPREPRLQQVSPAPSTASAGAAPRADGTAAANTTQGTASAAGAIDAAFGPLTASLAEALGLGERQGAVVVSVVDGGGAAKAGLQPLDVVLDFAGQAVDGPDELQAIASKTRVGFRATLRIVRRKMELDVPVVVSAAPIGAKRAVGATASQHVPSTSAAPPPQGTIGIRITPVSAELAKGLGLASTAGARVNSLVKGRAAEASGIYAGDIILGAAGEEVRTLSDLAPILGRVPDGQTIVVRIFRRDRTIELAVGPVSSPTPALPAGQVYAKAGVITPRPIELRHCFVQVQTTQNFFDRGVRSNLFDVTSDDSDKTGTAFIRGFVAHMNTVDPGGWLAQEQAYCDAKFQMCMSNSGMPEMQLAIMFCTGDRSRTEAIHAHSTAAKAMTPIDWKPEAAPASAK